MKTTPLAGGVRDQELTAYASAVGAYVIWGFLPLYFMFLGAIPADQVVAQRIIWSVGARRHRHAGRPSLR